MANTPPKPSVQERQSETLLEDLCTNLRHVACFESDLPDGERVRLHIQEVVAIYSELNARGVEWRTQIVILSNETKWQLLQLLEDCLTFPNKLPFVREADGIRRRLRCQLCGQAERPLSAKLFWFCDNCMQRVIEAIRHHTPLKGIAIFRTYNPECRCGHSDNETILACENYIEGELYGSCEQCILDELDRRKVE